MHCFKAVLVALADRLFYCSHRRTSFPVTCRTSVSSNGQGSTQKAETYIVCLECGSHLEYDWTTMRTSGQPVTSAGGDRDQAGYRTRAVFSSANRCFHTPLTFPPRVRADGWNKIAKSTSILLTTVLALALILTRAPGAEASSNAGGASFALFDVDSQGQGNDHQKHNKALKHNNDDGSNEGRDQDRNGAQSEAEKNHKTGKHQVGHSTAPVFGPRDRDIIVGYYQNRYSNLPPGLAKRGGKLPPGLERQLERNGTLPPGLQKRLEPFPPELSRQLPPLHPDYTRGVIGGSVVIVNRRTRAIIDVIYNVLSSSGR
jgi:hypothetical protein